MQLSLKKKSLKPAGTEIIRQLENLVGSLPFGNEFQMPKVSLGGVQGDYQAAARQANADTASLGVFFFTFPTSS